jgi:integrase
MANVRKLDNGKALVQWRDGSRKAHTATFDRERGPHGWAAFRNALGATTPAPAVPAGWVKQGTRWSYLPELAEGSQGPSGLSGGQSLADYGQAFISSKRFRGSDYYRLRSLASWSNHVTGTVGTVAVGTVTAGQLDAWQSQLEGKLAPRTIRNLRTIMHQVLNEAIRSGVRADNPLRAVDPVKGGRQHHSAPVQQAQVPHFMAAATQVDVEVPMAGDPSWFLDAFTVLMHTGLRMGELRALQAHHIQGDQVTVDQAIKRAVVDGRECGQWAGTPKTQTSSRTLYVDAETAQLLARRAAAAGPAGYLFPSERGAIVQASVMSHRWHHMLQLLRAAGVQIPADHTTPAGRTIAGITPHGLRRTFASGMVAEGVDVASIAAVMGHADKTTTLNIYTEDMSTADDKRTAAAAYAARMRGNQERHLQAV